MPKELRGHHRTKRRTEPRAENMREGAEPVRFQSLKGKQHYPSSSSFENRPPPSAFDGLDLSKLRP